MPLELDKDGKKKTANLRKQLKWSVTKTEETFSLLFWLSLSVSIFLSS